MPAPTLSSLRDAIFGFRLYRASFATHVAVAGIWPQLFPLLGAACTFAATRTARGGALDGLPVVVVALASGTPKLVMIVALASGLPLAKSCRATWILAVALGSLGIGLLVDAATLAVPFVESVSLAERVMWDYLPVATLLSGSASIVLVTGAIGRIARTIDAPRIAGRARRVQALAIGAVVAVLGAFAAWLYLPAIVATVLAYASVGAGLAAAVLHFVLAGDVARSLVALVEQRALASAASASEQSGPTRRTAPWVVALGLIGLVALCAFATSIALVRRREGRSNPLLLRAVDRGAAAVAERCGDPRSKLPIAPLEATHSTDDSESDPILTVTATGDVLHRRRLVARLSGACVLDPQGDVLVSVDARGLVSGPGREPLGAFKAIGTLKQAGATVTVGEVLVGPDGAMTGIANSGAVYFVAPPSNDAGHHGSGEEASSLPAEVTGDVSRARRTALLLDSLIGRLDPTDR